jgi:hypothetical protein
MGRRSRKRAAAGEQDLPPLEAPEERYEGPDGAELVLRGVLSAKSRQRVAAAGDPAQARAAATRDDAEARKLELLFELLAVRWTVSGVPTEGAKALLQRFGVAGHDERAFVRDALRRHCAEWFPDVEVP